MPRETPKPPTYPTPTGEHPRVHRAHLVAQAQARLTTELAKPNPNSDVVDNLRERIRAYSPENYPANQR